MELKFSLLAYFFFSNSVNKNYFTLNASADLSALFVWALVGLFWTLNLCKPCHHNLTN